MVADAAARAAVAAWRRALPGAAAAEVVATFACAAGAPAAAVEAFTDAVGVASVRSGGPSPQPPEGIDSPAFLGVLFEATLPRPSRRRTGTFYTPPALARTVVNAALRTAPSAVCICDPTVGGGAFLLAAADALVAAGRAPADVAGNLWGADVDATAVAVARLALRWWAARHGVEDDPAERIVVADALATRPPWTAAPDGFDLVVGNPPFLSQLRGGAVRDADRRATLVERFGPPAGGYVDDAALFLLAALELAGPAGRVALVQPESVLTAAHAGPVRARIDGRADLVEVWDPGPGWFDASVRVCVVELAARPAVDGVDGHPPGDAGTVSWGRRLAAARGVPAVDVTRWRTQGRLAAVARVVSGFRDQYYGLVPAVTDDDRPGLPRLVTTGGIGLLRCDRARRPVRFARRTWTAPVVDVGVLDTTAPAVASWVRTLLVPKVIVAPQGRMLLCAVDPDGSVVPSVPTTSVVALDDAPEPVTPWHLAAVLLAPPVTALVAAEHTGSGLARDTLRVPARALRELPLPADRRSWDVTADRLRALSRLDDPVGRADGLVALGPDLCGMYGVDPTDLVGWWAARIGATVRPLT